MKNNRRNPFQSVIQPVIREVLPSVMNHRGENADKSEHNMDTPYHRAIRAVIHHSHLAKLANDNKAMKAYHEGMVKELREKLPEVLARHRLTSAQIKDARNQRIPMRCMQWHLSQLEEDRRKDKAHSR